MRIPRFRFPHSNAVFHCFSRVVGGQFLLGDAEKRQLRELMRRYSDFCGIEILTYCLMDNHFHMLVRVTPLGFVREETVVERARRFYSRHHPVLQALSQPGSLRVATLARLRARMGDLSVWMKELKQAFSRWYNARKSRFGTLWASRFGSVLVEESMAAMGVVGRYIDLNPLRAGIEREVGRYEWCGYGEAIRGGLDAQEGILTISGCPVWPAAAPAYGIGLWYGAASSPSASKARLTREEVLAALARGESIGLPSILSVKIGYMTRGCMIGSPNFVERRFREFRGWFGAKRRSGARKARGLSGLSVLRDLRVSVFG